MKTYRDMFGNPLTKKDVSLAVQVTAAKQSITSLALQRSTGFGTGKVNKILTLLEDAGIVSKPSESGRSVIIRDQEQATNASLRLLNRSKK